MNTILLTRRRLFISLRITVAAAALFVALFTISAAGLVRADAQSDIDRELLDNLGSDLLDVGDPLDVGPVDEFDRELFAPRKNPKEAGGDNRNTQPRKNGPPHKQTAAGERAGDEIVRDLLEELRRIDEAQRAAAKNNAGKDGPQQGNPLVDLARQMRSIGQDQ